MQDALLHRIANRIRQSLELPEILSTTVAEVRAYLGTDRIKIYQFQPDGHGVVIAESLNSDRLPSLLGLHFPADDIPRYARELFVRARQRTIVDISTHEVGMSPLNCPETGESVDQSDIRFRSVDPCHQEYLTAMGVKSSIVVPIILEGDAAESYQPPSLQPYRHLWGLLISHHADPYPVSEAALEFIQAVVDQVAVGIAQSILLAQVRAQARQEANINRVTTVLQSSPTVNWQDALQVATNTLEAGGRLYLFANEQFPREIYTIGEQPALLGSEEHRTIEENLLLQKYLHSVVHAAVDAVGHSPWSVEWMRTIYELEKPYQSFSNAGCWAIHDIYQEPLFRTLAPFFNQTALRSALIIPLKHGAQILGCLSFFRSSIDTETLWAGYHDPDTRQLMARQSFEVWRQLKKDQAQGWTKEEIKYAQALGERFAATIKQYRLFQQVHQFNQELEQRVEERTTQLHLALSAAQMGTWEWDLSTNLKRWSARSFALFGADPATHSSPNHALFLSLIHPEDVSHVQQARQQALERQALYECEFRVVWPDRTTHWIYERGNYSFNAEGQPVKLAGICMDITERKQAEAILLESEERFSKVFEASPIGIAISTAADGQLVEVNESYLKLLDRQRAEVLGQTTLGLDFWEAAEERDRLIQQLMQKGFVRNQEVRFCTRTGEVRTGIISLEKIVLAGQVCILKMLSDISDRKNAEERLRASLIEKEVLLKEIHHRVKNNMQIITSLLRMQAQQLDDEAIVQPLKEAQNRVHSMALIHDQLYQVSDLAGINFGNYLSLLVKNLFHSYGVDTRHIIPTIKADQIILPIDIAIPCGLIVNELISNTLKHAFPSQKSGEILIQIQPVLEASMGQPNMGLTVADNGVGIPEGLEPETVESLGLLLVSSLTAQLCGSLSIDRSQGTCFHIQFPLPSRKGVTKPADNFLVR